MNNTKKEKFYWTTKDGKKIDVDKMELDHLRNVVKMIIKKNKIQNDFINDLYCEFLSEDYGDR